MILAQTAGLQTGTVPYAVTEGIGAFNGSCFQRPDLDPRSCGLWIEKTHWATCLPHEVRPGGFGCGGNNLSKCTIPGSPDGMYKQTPAAFNVSHIMFAYGYADPRCDVYRFWERPFPVQMKRKATNAHGVKPLIVRCKGQGEAARVLAIFASFGQGGQLDAKLNQTELGLRMDANAFDPQDPSRKVTIGAGGELSFWLNRHDFRMVVVE